MLKSNCHTHTSYCDGKNSAEEMVISAIEKGFDCIGFSGHSPMYFQNNWAMSFENYKKYIHDIKSLKEKYKDKIDIMLGLEIDTEFSGVDLSEFDYIICSFHQFLKNGKDYPVDYSPEVSVQMVNDVFDGSWTEMYKEYYRLLSEFVVKMKPQVVGHIDLITKFNEKNALFDETDPEYRQSVIMAIDKILDSDNDVLFEVNTGAMYRVGNTTPYPAGFIMEYLREKNAKLTVTSDSHTTESLDYGFDIAFNYCRKYGFDSTFVLTCDGVREIKL